MKIVVIVSEFPKVTETFAYRNLVTYRRMGHDARLFHIKRFRSREVVHDFMAEVMRDAFSFGYLAPATLGAAAMETGRAPRRVARLLGLILDRHRREPMRGLAVLACLPKALALGRWCRRNRVDHIHGEFAGHPATVAMIAAEAAGIGFSFSAHANDFIVSQALLPEKARAARFLRTISRHNLARLENLPGLPREKLQLVRCGVSRDRLAGPLPTPPGCGPLRILYVGSLMPKKGVRHLIDALAALPRDLDWQARILGGGPLEETLRAQAATLGLSTRIRFAGAQPAEQVAQAFASSHLAVVPSVMGAQGRVEGIPVVAMEALAHGLPLIASALSGIPELVEDGVTGWLVPPGDPAAIAAAISAIAADWEAASAIGARGRARVAAEYVVEENAERLARLMEEMR
ncbi:Glycosyltransferase involved in cell wall bisynthesis [Paracoccus isoporae]|uniref:Glycosyltransferase involved in cell wall bisynthesis n=1 Tax=Paracoccus isoporae TaxID=591205 RepID=A0A1G6XFQ6_9RHOB|nr:glycosyltransferase [Paracoccus isoporae]SDD77000.1 Glycosyltransferase involved in cell wall bisynthesis [Paracoccus isoporae]